MVDLEDVGESRAHAVKVAPCPRGGCGRRPPTPGYPFPLARGGSGVVYRARQPEFDRTVAIKVLGGPLDANARARFDRERQAIGRLSGNANIVTVYGSGFTRDNRPYMAMEFLPHSLAERVDQGPMPWQEAVEIGEKIASALQVAHDAGILHRDVKPENVLYAKQDSPKLGDFGIARMEGATRTATGIVTASLAHAAPEVLEGKGASAASDVYSLASTVYALIAGRPAFVRPDDDSILPVIARVATAPVPDLGPHGVPAEVAKVIEDAMAKDPAARPKTPAEFREQLGAAATAATAPAAAETAPAPVVAPVPDAAAPAPSTAPAPVAAPAPKPPKPPKPPKTPLTPQQKAQRRRLLLFGGLGALGLILLLVVVAAVAGGGGGGGGGNDGAGTGGLDPEKLVITDTIDIGDDANSVSIAEDAVWATAGADDTLSRVDPDTREVTDVVEVGDFPIASAVGEDGAIWTADNASSTATRVDPDDREVTDTIDVGSAPIGIAAGEGAIWVSNNGENTVSRIDPDDLEVTDTIDVGGSPNGITVGEGAVWTADFSDGTVTRIDPDSLDTDTIDVGSGPSGITTGSGAVWVTNFDDDTVSRIDPDDLEETDTIDVDAGPAQVAVAEDVIWIVDFEDNHLVRVEVDDLDKVQFFGDDPGDGPNSVGLGFNGIWVTNLNDDNMVRIGENED